MIFPIDKVREQFPALRLTDGGRARIYVDNPAGTQVAQRVAEATARCLLETNANLGGYFTTSVQAEAVVENAHRSMADFLGAESFREVVVGPSMTSLTFQFSRSFARMLRAGDEIVVTDMDHDGNIAPWLLLAEDLGLTVRWLRFNPESWIIEPEALGAVLTSKTRIVALNYASNLTGSINPMRALIDRIHEAGALVYVDAVQLAPHAPIDVRRLGCDFLACSSYKFFGPHLGIVWGREHLLEELFAYKVRPQTADLPYKFETGTPQIEQLAGLNETIEYFMWLGRQTGSVAGSRDCILAAFEAMAVWERPLTQRLVEGLRTIPKIRIAGITDPARFDERVPTVSFLHDESSPAQIARALADKNVFVWSGHNFALEVVRSLGIDEAQGVVRIGLAHYNTPEEVDATLEALSALDTRAL